jgi:mxaJ protein
MMGGRSPGPRAASRRSRQLVWVMPAIALALAARPPQLAAQSAAAPLRVCADPNNLPFSNREHQGFENAIASLVARDLGRSLQYTWWPQRRGFVRNTLAAGTCDVIMAVPTGLERVRTTAPYYRARYAFVTRADRALRLRSFDDPVLRRLRIGVQLVGDDYANPPPAHALARRGLVDNVSGYTADGAILDALRERHIDVAIVWGPLVARSESARHAGQAALRVVPVAAVRDAGLPMRFAIAMAVRRDDAGLQQELDASLQRRRADIEAILRNFGVPFEPARRATP